MSTDWAFLFQRRVVPRAATALSTAILLVMTLNVWADDSPATNKNDALADSSKLPVTEGILYSSGVGYFQRDGQVEGRSTIDLRFKVDDINDLLKSMVVQDFDGG